MTNPIEFISVTDTAKLIRAALKKNFPGVTFSVKSKKYAGGASINVEWTDGPLSKQVEAVTQNYAGGGFDGMIDMAYNVEAWLLPDGTATFSKTRGTAGSRGTVAPDQQMQPSLKARRVQFLANYVFCTRRYSEPLYRRALESVCRRLGIEVPAVVMGSCGPSIERGADRLVDGEWLSTWQHRELVRRTNYLVAPTLTANRRAA